MSDATELFCYNKGCAKKFMDKDNYAGACTFHPGEPYFHDAYKEWTCCKKRSVDFTEFLNYKGCTISRHNPEKPPEKEKPRAVDIPDISVAPPKPSAPIVRPDAQTPMTKLKTEVTPSLWKALQEQAGNQETQQKGKGDAKDSVRVGDACQHRGCGKAFAGAQSNSEICVFHPGVPIFHEGMKYWSCCQRKTSEFDQFMNQPGCEQGTHVWKKSDEEMKSVSACRTDWFQTGSHVSVNYYAKNSVPEKSVVEANPVKLHVKIVFDAGQSVFEKEFELDGIIDVENSEVTMAGPKVEVKLKKAEISVWKNLEWSK
ncbi:hypothetical protein RvY_02476 [Ramazzottius varieornatus]|uniref:CHORD domain-containing protein n=1 Tax=Ramazzottius varieornatus TaxID=947166 RepID=A0A1D1UQN7_RAMVA|nr:hypothetical protein RvY_02476 [Ramazzottius varieornatus]